MLPRNAPPQTTLPTKAKEPHAAERALWKAQREAGTNEVWTSTLNGAACEIPADIEPGWHDGHVYRVKPMKLTARVVSKIAKHKCPQDYVFNGTREEYRAECEKYGYAILSEIKEVVEKHDGDVVYGRSGMSLLDYFAAKAMQANVANWSEIHRPSQIANDSYNMAEAMMEERKRRNEQVNR